MPFHLEVDGPDGRDGLDEVEEGRGGVVFVDCTPPPSPATTACAWLPLSLSPSRSLSLSLSLHPQTKVHSPLSSFPNVYLKVDGPDGRDGLDEVEERRGGVVLVDGRRARRHVALDGRVGPRD